MDDAFWEDARRCTEECGGCTECCLFLEGDSHLKWWITAKPEIRIVTLTPDMEFLILASDGLWDQVSSQDAVDAINCRHSKHKKSCEDEDADGNVEEYGLVNVSPSLKLRRISLMQLMGSSRSPGCRKMNDNWKDVEEDFLNEFDSPLAKKEENIGGGAPEDENGTY